MKNTILFLFFFLCISNLKSQCPVPFILYPNGGEFVNNEAEIDIEFNYAFNEYYESSGPVDQVFFYYSVDGGENWILENTIPINEAQISASQIITYTWDISEIESDDCLIKIQKYEWGCAAVSKSKFSITRSPITPEDDSDGLIIYPNPASANGQFRVEVPNKKDQKFDLIIVDMKGETIIEYTDQLSSRSISTDLLIPGNYVLIYKTKERIKSKMFSIF